MVYYIIALGKYFILNIECTKNVMRNVISDESGVKNVKRYALFSLLLPSPRTFPPRELFLRKKYKYKSTHTHKCTKDETGNMRWDFKKILTKLPNMYIWSPFSSLPHAKTRLFFILFSMVDFYTRFCPSSWKIEKICKKREKLRSSKIITIKSIYIAQFKFSS